MKVDAGGIGFEFEVEDFIFRTFVFHIFAKRIICVLKCFSFSWEEQQEANSPFKEKV